MNTCPACHAPLATIAGFCPFCGQRLLAAGADLPLSAVLAQASSLLAQGEIDPAIAMLLPHAERSDADPMAVYALATAYLQRGRFADALPLLAAVVEQRPGHAQAHAYLGMAYLHTYQPAEAREAIELARALAPDDFVVNLKYGELLLRLGYYREAVAPLEHALAGPSPNGPTLEFTRRLLRFAREKSPNSFTRPVNRFPRLAWRRRTRQQPTLHEEPLTGIS